MHAADDRTGAPVEYWLMLIPALSAALPLPFPLRWGFSTREDEGSPELPPRRTHQVHGTAILEVNPPTLRSFPPQAPLPDADGLWTSTPGLRVGIRTADCTPILLAGPLPDRPWAAALHAGWRGAVGGVGSGEEPGILRVGAALYRSLGGRPEDLVWALGPALMRCHFEVGPEVVAAARKDPAWREGLVEPGPRGRPHLDLQGFLRAQALDLGLDPAREASVPRCTVCDNTLLYSHRRGDEGRQWGWVEIGE